MWRIVAIVGGVAGAVALSQFPEFSQQYLQRLAGKVDALSAVAAEFDASAAKAGLTREAALASLDGSAFSQSHQADMRATLALAETLSANLAALRAASALERMTMPQRLGDIETLRATWADYRPAIPTTADGAVTAGLGYVGGWVLAGGLWSALGRLFRRRRAAW